MALVAAVVPVRPHVLFGGVQSDVLHTAHVSVYFETSLDAEAQDVVAMYPDVKDELEIRVGWHLDYRPTVVLIRTSETFQKMIGSNLFVAVAVPQKRLIVIDHSKMTTRPFTLRTTLKHELCHLLLHRHIREGALPKWLDEGVAQWTSDGMAEIVMGRSRAILERAALTGHYIPLQNLEDFFPRTETALLLAYEESKSVVEYIIQKFGEERLMRVIGHLREGHDINEALERSLRLSVYELEDQWRAHLKGRVSWLAVLSAYLYEILFFIAAILAVLGSIKLLRRRRAYNSYVDYDDD